MVPKIRESFNASFTYQQYQEYLEELSFPHPGQLDFRVAETPVFCDKIFTDKMISACESIVDVIISPDFKEETKKAIPKGLNVPGENKISNFIAFDFGVCENEQGDLEPQLIEMQGFPTLFSFQVWQAECIRNIFSIPEEFDNYLNGFNRESYLQFLKEIILGIHNPEHVILLEIFPEKQKTRIDFLFTKDYTGIKQVC
ncbi:MAG TPA: hypothetical protein VK369_11670, partial [Segetibacter sp.]|nr:hypothetical protein [Segetibacter sp.]